MNPKYEPVAYLMSTPAVTLDPSTHVGELLQLAESLGIHHFPLVDASGLLGLVCTCDVEGARPEQTVAQFARRAPVTVRPEAMAQEATAQLITHGVGSVVVADEEGVWGILTRADLAAAVPELMQDVHCVYCDSRDHLRPGHADTWICRTCAPLDPG
ncbi:MAG TPA: CBS domain-containing protein [Polyangiaceae bacterium]|nr:CBS domain-containing protein [Polyangiaceae bacterium]